MTVRSLSQATLARLAESGLDAKDAAALGITDVGGRYPGFCIPYNNGTDLHRTRHHEPVQGAPGTKPHRYSQPRDTNPELYLPNIGGHDWDAIKADPNIPVWLTEGELKAAALCKAGFAAIGVGGVANWHSKKLGGALPQFDEFVWPGRTLTIAYDADIVEKPAVAREERLLGAELTGRGASVLRVRLPLETKGADDFLVANGLPRAMQRARRAWLALPTEPVEPPTDADKVERTQLGLARRFVQRFSGQVIHVRKGFGWAVYVPSEGRFALDAEGTAMRLMCSVVDDIRDKELPAERIPEARKALVALHRSASGYDFMKGALKLAAVQLELSVGPEQLDADPNVVNTANGWTIDLRDGKARRSAPEDYHSKCLGVAYDPSAKAPQWMTHLKRVFNGDKGRSEYLQRLSGHVLSGHATQKALFVFHGPRDTGKSTTINVIQKLMGEFALTLSTDVLISRGQSGLSSKADYELAQARGARLIVLEEPAQGSSFNNGLVKSLTGMDRVKARPIYMAPIEFDATFKLIIGTNHMPSSNGDDAMTGRVVRVPFEHVFKVPESERRDMAAEYIAAEGAGILNWAIEGAVAYARCGLAQPESVRSATAEYIKTQDVIGRWMSECCERDSAGHEVPFKDLYETYTLWAQRNYERVDSKTELSKKLTAKGFEPRTTTRRDKDSGRRKEVVLVKGLRLVSEPKREPQVAARSGSAQVIPMPQTRKY